MNDASRSILDSLRRIVQGLRISSASTQKMSGVGGAQAFVLQKLGEGAASSINELAQRTHTHQSSVSVVVEKLAQDGFVQRKPAAADARQIEISLTPAGKKVLQKMPETLQQKLVRAIDKMPPADRAELARLMNELTELAGLPPEAPMLFFQNRKKAGTRDSKRKKD